MKKTFLAPFLFLGMALAGCGAATAGDDLFVTPTSETESALTNSFVSANTITEGALLPKARAPKLQHQQHSFEPEDIVDDTHSSNGLVVVKNDVDRIGFYSVLHGDYLIAPRFEKGWVSYTVTDTNYVGFILSVKYNDEYLTYDGFGNELIDNPIASVVTEIINQKVYLTLNGAVYYEYGSDGVAKRIDAKPQAAYNPSTEDDYTGPKTDDLFVEGRMDLDAYGYSNYSILVTRQGLYTTFHEGKPTVSFYVATDYEYRGLIGSKMVFQRVLQTTEDATRYDFTRDNNKYSLETLLVDFITGEKANKNAKVIIQAITPLKKAEGSTTKYSYVTYYTINDNGLMVNPIGAIVDEEFRIHNDASGMAINSFIELENGNFFNTVTKMLYDSEMNVITSLAAMDATYLRNMKMFRGKLNNSYGLVNENGKVVAEFRYSDIYVNEYPGNDNVIVKKGTDAFRLNLTSGATTFVGSNIVKRGENLFSNSDGSYFSSDKNLIENGLTSTRTATLRTYLESAESVYFVKMTDSRNGTKGFDSLVYEGDVFPGVPTEVKGDEVTTAFADGSDLENAVSVKAGVNEIHTIVATNASYAVFSPEESGYYSFYLPDHIDLEKMTLHEGKKETGIPLYNVSYVSKLLDSVIYKQRVVVHLTASAKYELRFGINDTSQQLYNLVIEKENGTDDSYPIEISSLDTKLSFAPSIFGQGSGVKTIYATYASKELGVYKLASQTEGDAATVSLFGGDVTEGCVIGANEKRTFAVTFDKELSAATSFSLTKTDYEGTSGSNENVPYWLQYKGEASEPTDKILPAKSEGAEHAYYRFKTTYGGNYLLSMSFDKSIDLRVYALYADGRRSLITNRVGYSVVTNVPADLDPYSSILVEIDLLEGEEINVTSFTVRSELGRSYENPGSSFDVYNANRMTFVKLTGDDEPSSHLLKFNQYIGMELAVDDKLIPMDAQGEIVRYSTSSPVYLKVGATYSTESLNYTNELIFDGENPITVDETVEFEGLDWGEHIYGTYTNTTNDIQSIRLKLDADSIYLFNYTTSEDYFVHDECPNASGEFVTSSLILTPGSTFRFFMESLFAGTKGSYCVSVDKYTIDLEENETNNNPWEIYGHSFYSTNIGMPTKELSKMSVHFQEAGKLLFSYYSDGKRYDNYLLIKLNDTVVLDCSEQTPSDDEALASVEVNKGDVLTVEFVRKNAVGANSDCAYFSVEEFAASIPAA